MAYQFYLDGVQLPVAPSKLQLKIKNQNKTMTLINESEVNVLKLPGLTEISFDFMIPHTQYPFAEYPGGFKPPKYFLDKLETLKTGKKPFQFIVSRISPGGERYFGTDLKVSIEDYTIKEDAGDGFDLTISIKLKQYRDYGAKLVTVIEDSAGQKTAEVKKSRPTESKPEAKTYTVQKNDTLYNIAKKMLGDGARWKEIYNLNQDKISNPNLIYPGQVFVLP